MSEPTKEIEQWWDEYKPVPNHFTDDYVEGGQEYLFETYGQEVEYIFSDKTDIHNIWTWCDGDTGSYVTAGRHYVNRIGYYITEKAWTDEDLVIAYDTYQLGPIW